MQIEKQFKLRADEIIELIQGFGGCLATDKITVLGELVNYMYRDQIKHDADSGWRFFSGTEDEKYIRDNTNSGVYNVNTIANYDPAIIPYLEFPIGTHLERVKETSKFRIISG